MENGNSTVLFSSPILSALSKNDTFLDEQEPRLLNAGWDFGPTDTTANTHGHGHGISPDGWSSSVEDAFVEGSHLWFLLVAGYSLVFTVGVLGNAMLLAALCGSGSRARALPIRNHLMVNLAAADLLVTAVCVPITACAAASHACWPDMLVSWMCQLGPLLQRTPVAASTLSLALLSLDRWAALRHPRFAQRFRDKRFILMSMGIIWVLASLVSAPTLWAREWETKLPTPLPLAITRNDDFLHNASTLLSHPPVSSELDPDWISASFLKLNENFTDGAYPSISSTTPEILSDPSQTWNSWESTGMCTEKWTNAGIQLAYAATYLGTAFVSPALIVAACHASVSQKLTAQLQVLANSGNGTAGSANSNNNKGSHHGPSAAAGERSRRPTQVIIVARDLNNPPSHHHLHPMSAGNGMHGNGNATSRGNEAARFSKKLVTCDPSSDEDDVFLQMQIQADLESFRQISQYQQNNGTHGNRHGLMKAYSGTIPRVSISSCGAKSNHQYNHHGAPLRAARRETSIIRAHRKLRKKLSNPWKPPPPLLPTYSSQSFRSRRRAANLLAALAGVFVFCWVPYVVCVLWDLFAVDKSLVRLLIPFALFLGHAHSAMNPIVSWRLNRSAFVRFQRKPNCSCLPTWMCFGWCQTCTWSCCPCADCDNTSSPSTTRSHTRRARVSVAGGHSNSYTRRQCCPCCLRFARPGRRSSSPEGWNRSSTNEAALGAFHPKYLNRMPLPDPISRCHTSHFLR